MMEKSRWWALEAAGHMTPMVTCWLHTCAWLLRSVFVEARIPHQGMDPSTVKIGLSISVKVIKTILHTLPRGSSSRDPTSPHAENEHWPPQHPIWKLLTGHSFSNSWLRFSVLNLSVCLSASVHMEGQRTAFGSCLSSSGVGSGDWTQVNILAQQVLLLTEPSLSGRFDFGIQHVLGLWHVTICTG